MKVQKYRIESFEWARIPEDIPKENLVLAVVKTSKPTIHPDDTEYPIRLFNPNELHEAARSLAKRFIGLNHIRLPDKTPYLLEFSPLEKQKFGIQYAFTVDANYNSVTRCVEALLCLPRVWVNKIRMNKVSQVSVEYSWRDEHKTEGGIEFLGLIFDKVDLLEDVGAGDTDTQLRLVESADHLFEGDLAVLQCKDCNGECTKCKECSPETEFKQELITEGIDDGDTTFFLEESDVLAKRLGEPLSADFQKIHDAMVSKYGPEKGKNVYYAWVNKHGYDDTKAMPSRKKGKEDDIAVVNEDKELIPLPKAKLEDGKIVLNEIKKEDIKEVESVVGQIPEKPMNVMANDPTPMSSIYPDPKFQDKTPKDTNTLGQTIVDRRPESNEVIHVTDEDKSKQRVESAVASNVTPKSTTTVDTKVEEKKKTEAQPPTIPEPITPPMPTQPQPTNTPPVIAATATTAQSVNTTVVPPVTIMTPETQKLIESQAETIKNQDAALKKLQESMEQVKAEKSKIAEKVKRETKKELVDKLEEILPERSVMTNWGKGGKILADQIRKVVYEEKEEE